MAKEKAWTVTMKPAKKVQLKTRNPGEERTAVRVYHLAAASRGEAQSLAEEQERLIGLQNGSEAWSVDSVSAA